MVAEHISFIVIHSVLIKKVVAGSFFMIIYLQCRSVFFKKSHACHLYSTDMRLIFTFAWFQSRIHVF